MQIYVYIQVYLNLCIIKILPLLGIFTHLKEKIYTIMISQWYNDNFYRVKNKNIDGFGGQLHH